MGRILKRFMQGTGVLSLAAAGYISQDEGLRRCFIFWGSVGPIYAHYVMVDKSLHGHPEEERAREFKKLHVKYAPRVEKMMLRLRGYFIKIAQMGSTRDDFVPEEYMKFFQSFQDRVPPEWTTEPELKKVISESLGRPFEEVFDSIEPVPLGAATIGQVHKATLKGGEVVAVKLQYPVAERFANSDLDLVIRFCELAQPQNVEPMKVLKKQFESEYDYRKEAELQAEFVKTYNNHPKWSSRVKVPNVHQNLCTKNLLVMEYLEGQPVVKALKENARLMASQKGMTEQEFLDLYAKEAPPSSAYVKWVSLMLWLQDALANIPKRCYNYTVAPLTGSRLEYSNTVAPMDIRGLLDTIVQHACHQLLIEGVFNADPHPGNLLMCPDGKIGLLDFGQVGRLDKEDRILMCKIFLSLHYDKRTENVRLTKSGGVETRDMNPEVLFRLSRFFYDKDTPEYTDNVNAMKYMDHMERVDPQKAVPAKWMLPGRMLIILRAFGHAFNDPLEMAKVMAPHAEKVLRQEGMGDYVDFISTGGPDWKKGSVLDIDGKCLVE